MRLRCPGWHCWEGEEQIFKPISTDIKTSFISPFYGYWHLLNLPEIRDFAYLRTGLWKAAGPVAQWNDSYQSSCNRCATIPGIFLLLLLEDLVLRYMLLKKKKKTDLLKKFLCSCYHFTDCKKKEKKSLVIEKISLLFQQKFRNIFSN